MAMLSARQTALIALREWRIGTRFADSIISELLDKNKLRAPDRGFAVELFYGVLRNLTLLDFWIRRLRSGSIDVDLRDLLRLGIYQLLCLKTAEHAAVFETVELAPKQKRGVANAVLRSAARRQEELQAEANRQPLAVRASHPEFLITRWQRNFGSRATEALCEWNNEPPPIYGRINKLKIGREEFARTYPNSTPLSHHPNFVKFNTLPTNALERGDCYIQDPSTAISCQLLNPRPGEKMLDACAAPGGKTTYLAELMNNRGVIVACDRDADRMSILRDNIRRVGVTIARTVLCDWEHAAAIPEEIVSEAPFDRILVDAPCSNTGVVRRRVDVRWRLRQSDFLAMQDRQLKILRAVTPLLKSGGMLVYSTCSLEPEENESVVQRAIAAMSILELASRGESLPFREGFDGAFAAKLTGKI